MALRQSDAFFDHHSPVLFESIIAAEDRQDADALIDALEKRFLQSKLKPAQEDALRDYLSSHASLNRQDLLGAISLVMSTPEYQVT